MTSVTLFRACSRRNPTRLATPRRSALKPVSSQRLIPTVPYANRFIRQSPRFYRVPRNSVIYHGSVRAMCTARDQTPPEEQPSQNTSFEQISKESDPFDEKRIMLMETALTLVPRYGWTVECLAAAAEKCGMPSTAHGLALNGAPDLVFYFVDKCNHEWVTSLSAHNLQELTLKKRLSFLIRTRLEYNIPFVKANRWSEALKVTAHPSVLPTTLEKIASLADEICYQSGDRATDTRWYTKRLMVSSIYTSAELYMLTDISSGYKDTWEFVDRRIDDMARLSKVQDEAGTLLHSIGLGIASLINPWKR